VDHSYFGYFKIDEGSRGMRKPTREELEKKQIKLFFNPRKVK